MVGAACPDQSPGNRRRSVRNRRATAPRAETPSAAGLGRAAAFWRQRGKADITTPYQRGPGHELLRAPPSAHCSPRQEPDPRRLRLRQLWHFKPRMVNAQQLGPGRAAHACPRRETELSGGDVALRAAKARRTPRRGRAFTALGARVEAEPIAPGLHVVATPIGNLGDITLARPGDAGRRRRGARRGHARFAPLLAHYGVTTPLVAYHEHNAAAVRPRLLARRRRGGAGADLRRRHAAGLRSRLQAGRRRLAAGIAVTAVPGPSAVLAALVVAGLPTDRFFFEGFLPPKSAARRARINELAQAPGTLVFFESPRRLAGTLADLAAELGDRPAAVARELTKFYETTRRGTLASLPPPLAGGAAEGRNCGAGRPPRRRRAGRRGGGRSAARGPGEPVRQGRGGRGLRQTGAPRRRVYARALALAGAKR